MTIYEWAASLSETPETHVCEFQWPRSMGDYMNYGYRRRCYACDAWEPLQYLIDWGHPTPRTLQEARAQRYFIAMG